MTTRPLFLVAASLCMLSVACPLARSQPPRDYGCLSPKELGIKLAEPKKDPRTGFVVAGPNTTACIRKLTHFNGLAVPELETSLKNLFVRYLDDRESLLEVMAADNHRVVEELGLTHQELAKHLHMLGAIRMDREVEAFTYHGRRLRVEHVVTWTWPASSPFKDGTKEPDTLLTVHNLDNGKKVSFYRLMPHMIERYGFYAGKSRYRVEPREIIEVLDFLKEKGNK